MFESLKNFFAKLLRKTTNESGALPAIMVGAILISATAVLLAGYSLTMTKNAEMNMVKTNTNYYLNSCESILEKETFKTFPSTFDTETKAKIIKLINTDGVCNQSDVIIKLVGDPVLYTPAGQTHATSVKLTLVVDVNRGALKIANYEKVEKYLDYAEREEKVITPNSYIDSFDENGLAVWITPET